MGRILAQGLRSVRAEELMARSLRLEGGNLSVGGHSFPVRGSIFVLAFGKAGLGMARAAERLLGDAVGGGIAITPWVRGPSPSRISVRVGTHPSLSEENVRATREAMRAVRRLGGQDILLALISGGGSSLLCWPARGISWREKDVTAQLLLRAGATIEEVNAVRKHLSRVKGGWLAKLAQPATVISLIISDVVGDDPSVIASGPTSPDPTTYEQALQAIRRRGVERRVPTRVLEHLRRGAQGQEPETPKPGDPIFARVHNFILANGLTALRAMKNEAQRLGYRSLIITSHLRGEAREVAKAIASILISCRLRGEPLSAPACLLFGGESTVRVRGKGRGGRNQELALSAALELSGVHGVLLAALASDGVDGTSDAAGALVDGHSVRRALSLGLRPEAFLRRNDSHGLFSRLGDQLRTGPTGTNVGDLIVGLVAQCRRHERPAAPPTRRALILRPCNQV